MTLLSQTIAWVDMAASSLGSRTGEAVETAREARRAREHCLVRRGAVSLRCERHDCTRSKMLLSVCCSLVAVACEHGYSSSSQSW